MNTGAAPAPRTSWWNRVWEGLGYYGRIKTLWQLAVAFYVTSQTISVLPGGWHPPQYWAIAGVALFGSWAVLATLTTAVQKLWAISRRRLNPSSLVVTAHGGEKGFFELRHTGGDATYWADGRIVSTNDESPNPAPSLFQAHVLWKGVDGSPNRMLKDGEWALIVIATIESDGFSRAWLAIRRGRFGYNTAVSDAGAVVEMRIRSDAGYDQLHLARVERILRRGEPSTIRVTVVDTPQT